MNEKLSDLPRIKQCTCCGKGTARRHPSGILECDECGAFGDPFLGIMDPPFRWPENDKDPVRP